MGKVSGEEKNQLISSASALIVPSTCRETFGMVVVEAFAFGKPVIASRMEAYRNLFEMERLDCWLSLEILNP